MRTCFGFCAHVLQQCLANYAYLEPDWNAYVEAMLKIARELEGTFSLEATLGPINVKVSEAIMNFQESGVSITQRVFAACGRKGIQKREAKFDDEAKDEREEDEEKEKEDGDERRDSRHVTGSWSGRSSAGGTGGSGSITSIGSNGSGMFERNSVERWKRVVGEVRKKLIGLRRYWSKLPRNLCSDDRLVYPRKPKSLDRNGSTLAKRCWNGTDAIDS